MSCTSVTVAYQPTAAHAGGLGALRAIGVAFMPVQKRSGLADNASLSDAQRAGGYSAIDEGEIIASAVSLLQG